MSDGIFVSSVQRELIDQAEDFVMSKVARSVGTRAESAQAPVEYELPREAVAEAIVNAVAHRDYTSKASVQVSLFADRLEVWNPGELPPALTIEQLRRPHASVLRNPLIADPLFLAGYVEKAGTGILDMIARCRAAGLPAPEFRQEGGEFIQILRRPEVVATPQVTPQVEDASKAFSDSELSDIASVLGVTTPKSPPKSPRKSSTSSKRCGRPRTLAKSFSGRPSCRTGSISGGPTWSRS